MLDWFSGYVGYDASQMALGTFWEATPCGEVVRSRSRWETARGSWESGVQVTRGLATEQMRENALRLGFLCSDRAVLRVSGNPSKFLQGHNAAGPSVSQLGPVVQAMCRAFAEGLRPADVNEETLPAVHRSRVDVTTAVALDTHERVHEWLRLAASTTRSRHGRAIDSSGTVYWGKKSRRWTLKAYCKHCELKAHPPTDRELLSDLLEWTRDHLRLELCLRRPELKDRGTLEESIIWEYANRLEVPTMKGHARINTTDVPAPALPALLLWMNGEDVSVVYSRPTFYRHRRAILDAVGFDISMSAKDQVEADPDALLGIEALRDREVTEVPERIQRSLFGAG